MGKHVLQRIGVAVLLVAGMFLWTGCSGKKDEPSGDKPPSSEGQETPDAAKTPGDTKAPGDATTAAKGLDVSLVAPEFCVALVVHPARLLKSPILAPLLGHDLVAPQMAQFKQAFLDPATVEQAVILGMPQTLEAMNPGEDPAESVGVIVRFIQPTEAKEVAKMVIKMREPDYAGEPNEKQMGGKKCYQLLNDPFFIAQIDDRTVAFSNEPLLGKMLADKDEPNPLKSRLAKLDPDADAILVVALEPLAEIIGEVTEEMRDDEDVAPFAAIPEKLKTVAVALDFAGDTLLEIDLEAKDEAGAQTIKKLADNALAMGKGMYGGAKEMISEEDKAQAGTMVGMADQMVDGVAVAQAGTHVTIALSTPEGLAQAVPNLIREGTIAAAVARRRARKANELNDLQQIGLGIQNYDSARRRFPTQAICDENGKPLLSWRVAILYFMANEPLYGAFDRKKSWDSPENEIYSSTPVLEYMIGQDVDPDEEWDGKTSVMVIQGEGTAFDGQKHIGGGHFPDGSGNTICVVVAGPDKRVPWAAPQDLPFVPDDPKSVLGTIPDEGIKVLMCDGSVRILPKDIPSETFKALLTRAGGEKIDWSQLQPDMMGEEGVVEEKIEVEGVIDEPRPDKVLDPAPSQPKPDFRTWTSANGQSTFDAQLIKKEGESITLKRKDTGQVITVPLSVFNQADQDFVKSLP